MASDHRKIQRALLSVSDKTGLVDFAQGLRAMGIELVSTGGTGRALAAAGIAARDIADVTGFPEMMDGRLKTLHPKVHGGLLAQRENPEHEAAMLAHAIGPIDLLVVTLYPFEASVASGKSVEACIENIDIGGPAMIRAAAKNHADVAVVVDVEDYAVIAAELARIGGATSLALRRRLAQKAFARTAAYDAAISNWFAEEIAEPAPAYRAIGGRLIERLRYGENPHQTAAFYRTPEQRFGVASARQVQGKPMSFNNINDTNAAFECVAEFDPVAKAAVAIIKHANPCGVAVAASLREAYAGALACDPLSAFGGIVALNRTLDAVTAAAITSLFTEVVIAPDADEAARALIARKKDVRLIVTGGMPDPRATGLDIRSVAGGLLVQSRDTMTIADLDLDVVSERQPSATELADLTFAFQVAKHVKSNAIVLARNHATVGIGAGQMSRVDAMRIANWKAGEAAKAAGLSQSLAQGAVAASDAFFPFPDALHMAAEAGVRAVIQPGGSIRDKQIIEAANALGLAMVVTGTRHFRH
jgi:phosphoribosylaminoimidazolecarboxamide formyltransferase/IMP cyclohydrolase